MIALNYGLIPFNIGPNTIRIYKEGRPGELLICSLPAHLPIGDAEFSKSIL
jgi:hypothetical protein